MSIFREHTYTHAQMYTPSDMWIHDSNTGLATHTLTQFSSRHHLIHTSISDRLEVFLLVLFFSRLRRRKKISEFMSRTKHIAHSINHNIATTHSMRRRKKMISKMKFFFSGLEIWNELNTEFQLRERKIELPKIDWSNEMSECVWWRQFGCRDDDDDDGDVYIETSSNGSNSNRNSNSNSTELIWWWWNWHTFGTYSTTQPRRWGEVDMLHQRRRM